MTAGDYGWIGVWLLAGSLAVIVVEMVVGAVWTARVARRSRALSERLAGEQRMLQEDLDRLRRSIEEMERLWRPYARALRWFRHPLVVALLGSWSRRRAAAR